MPLRHLLSAPLLLLASCVSQPERAIPEPYAETLAWDGAEEAGAFVGLKTEENDSDSLEDLFFDPGVRVAQVAEGSPAFQAGFAVGDVVLSVNGESVDDPGAFDQLVSTATQSDDLTFETRRGDHVFDITVRPSAAPGASAAPTPRYLVEPSRTRASWATVAGGVRLVAAHDASPVLRDGLAVGDVVTSLDDTAMNSARELVRTVTSRPAGSRVAFTLADGRRITVELLSAPTRITSAKIPFVWEYEAAADGSTEKLDVIDIVILRLFRFERDGNERTWSLLTLFGWTPFQFGTGVGELSS